MPTLHRIVIVVLGFACLAVQSFSQSPFLKAFSLSQDPGQAQSLPPSNSISHISVRDSELWIGTGKGLARSNNGGRSWESFRTVPQFVNTGIFAINVKGDTVWASTGFTQNLSDQDIQTGSGYTYSTDNGTTWTHLPQTLDGLGDSLVTFGVNTVYFLPVVVPEQNVTYDIAVTPSAIWIASWASGLRKSTDQGHTWQRIVLPAMSFNSIAPTDTLIAYRINPVPSPAGDNFKAFSVFAESDSVIWAGTAGGINKSTDAGMSWTKFNTLNQRSHILSNWVIAIKEQHFGSTSRIWCTNWLADQTFDPNQQYGVSYSDDGGRIWKNFLQGIKAYDFAFKDSVAYVASDEGLYRTSDGGLSWNRSGTIIDPANGQVIGSGAFFAVGVIGDTVYGGSSDGLARTIDNGDHPFGQTWEVIRAYQPVGSSGSTYAYPNPFSPGQEPCRVHYSTAGVPASVTIEVFDFSMHRVRTIIKDAQRSGLQEHDEIWDGRDDSRNSVTNGVYFYRVVLNNGDPIWGKIMVLQ